MASLDSTVSLTTNKQLKLKDSSCLALSEKYSFQSKVPYKANGSSTCEYDEILREQSKETKGHSKIVKKTYKTMGKI